MKVVIPFAIPHGVVPKEDYFELCRDITNGEFVPTDKMGAFEVIKKIWGQKIHAHGRGLPFPELSAFFAKKSVYTPHNNHIGASPFTQMIRKFFFNRYDWVVAQTNFGRRNYIREGIDPRKIVVLPIPIDYQYYSKPRGEKSFRKKYGLGDEPFALCIGARYTKNPEVIIDACKKAGIKIVFIAPKSKSEVQKGFEWLIPDMKILEMEGSDVIFTGTLPKSEVLSALDAASIYINSADDGGECFSLVVYEAAAAGVPLCLPDFGVFETFKDAALFHNNHDYNQLAANINRYLDDPELMKKNSSKARQIAKRFDYSVVRKKFERFYKEKGFI